jgi:hypothetical protein
MFVYILNHYKHLIRRNLRDCKNFEVMAKTIEEISYKDKLLT